MIKRINKKAVKVSSLVVIFFALTFGSYAFFQSHFLPLTYIGGKNVSFKSFESTKGYLKKESEDYLNSKIQITLNNITKDITVKDLGVVIYPEKTVQTISEIKKINFKTPILATVSLNKMQETLDLEFGLSQISAKNASLYFDEKNELTIKDGNEGFKIDEKNLRNRLKKKAQNLDNESIKIGLLKDLPSITREDLINKKDELISKLDKNITIEDPIYKDDWVINLKKTPDWVSFKEKTVIDKTKEGLISKTIAIEVNEDKLNQFVDEKISKWLDIPASNVVIEKKEDGTIFIDGKGNDGKKIDRIMLKESIEIALESGISKVPVPLLTIEPEIKVSEDLKKLGIKERIGIGHTSFYGSPANRIHNIIVSSKRFNGILLAPGEAFSFNETLGPVDGKSGYKMELVIKKEGTIPEYGGGICQVSTTVYRAALLSGLNITNRRSHSYAVSYYSQVMGDGLDATIYLGGQDFNFVNDTANHILIQTYTDKDDKELYTVIYGTKDGRSVEMEGPYISDKRGAPATIYEESTSLSPGETKQIEKPHGGFTAVWYRYLTKDGKTEVETIKSVYKAMPAKVLVGAGSPPPTQ